MDSDTFAAITLAGNVLQFIVHVKDVYLGVEEARQLKTGFALAERHQDGLSRLGGVIDTIVTNMAAIDDAASPNEKRMRDLGKRCVDLSNEIRAEVTSHTSKEPASLFKTAKSVVWGEETAKDLEQRTKDLDDLLRNTLKTLLTHISGKQSGLEKVMIDLVEQNRKLEMSRTDELQYLKSEVAETIALIPPIQAQKSSESLSHEAIEETQDTLEQISSKLLSWAWRARVFRSEQAIIESLRFEGMLHRHSDIANAHHHSYKWVHKQNLHFKQWLESGEGLYWVTGDAGAGKSTLIKYLAEDSETHEALTGWAEPKALVKASFYFWFSGTGLQKSQEGLLRSLLFELLRKCPDSIRAACPSRWDAPSPQPWTEQELLETLKSIRLHSSTTRFCLFVDGLDEYQAPSRSPSTPGADNTANDFSGIIDVMKTLASLPDVKLCVSSRPWPVFEEAFGQYENLKFYVNDQNRDDISLYIRDKFAKSPVFAKRNAYSAVGLVQDLVNDSNGVFLWVYLAVAYILRGVTVEEGTAEVRRRLDETPKTLKAMFERMLESVEENYHEQEAQILQVALHATEPLNVFTYSFIGNDSYDPMKAEVRTWSEDECVTLAKATEARMKVRCPDLIKIWSPEEPPMNAQDLALYRVDFIHRTVRDFLALEETQCGLTQRMTVPFHPVKFICGALLMQIKAVSIDPDTNKAYSCRAPHVKGLLEKLVEYAREIELESDAADTELLDELRRVMTLQSGTDKFTIDGDSFTGIMVQKDLYKYVETRLPEALQEKGRPLLECALLPSPFWSHPATVPSPRMATLLLSHGASTRQSTVAKPSKSVWELYMATIYSRHKHGSNFQTPRQRQDQVLIVQELLSRGADAYLKLVDKWSDAKPTVGKANGIRYPTYIDLPDIIEAMYSEEERAVMEALIQKRRAGYVPSWLRWK